MTTFPKFCHLSSTPPVKLYRYLLLDLEELEPQLVSDGIPSLGEKMFIWFDYTHFG